MGPEANDLAGSSTGVFVGLCNNEWARGASEAQTGAPGAFTGTGAAQSIAANRKSAAPLRRVWPFADALFCCSLLGARRHLLHPRVHGPVACGGHRLLVVPRRAPPCEAEPASE